VAPRKHTFSRKTPHVDRIARALLDAEVFGDKRAAEKHGVHYNTIKNWRGDEPTPAIREAMERLRAEVASGWIDEGRLLRRKLIDRIASVAADTEDLDALINALRRTHEVVMSHEIVHDPDAQPDLAHQLPDPGEAEGEGGEEGE
jgi:hypothetical protein